MLTSQIKIKVRPNNQISLTVGNFAKKLPAISQSHVFLDDQVQPWQIKAKQAENQKAGDRYNELKDMYRYRLSLPLDIISKSQRDKKDSKPKPNKPKNFTRNSGQKLRESGAAMDIACNGDTRFCHEITLTLPANNVPAFKAIAEYSAYAVNRLFQPIRRKYGDMCLWFFVWEYQKRGALHMHIAIYHPDECEGLYISAMLIEQWQKILGDISDMSGAWLLSDKCKGDREMKDFYQFHTMPIQKDVGRYFSKYAGKEESKNNWYVKKYPVSRFWGSSKQIKNIVKQNSFEFTWDYFADQVSKDEKLTEIIQNILAKITIVSSSSYEFNIKLAGKSRLNKYKNGRKILSVDDDKSVANGERFTFYCTNESFENALNLCKKEAETF